MVTLIIGEHATEGGKEYLILEHYTRVTVEADRVCFWTPDNLNLPLKKTAELKAQLDNLLSYKSEPKTSKGLEKFS